MELLIVRQLKGVTTPDEVRQLSDWRKAAPENERLYQEVARLWTLLGEAFPPGELSAPPDPDVLIRRAQFLALPGRETAVWPRPSTKARWLRQAIAAAALIVLGIVLARLRVDRSTAPAQVATATADSSIHAPGFGAKEFVTGATEMSTVTLSDGTVIRLAPRTRLRLTGGANDREVSLDGRAFFAVAKAGGRLFRIRTPAGDVTVLGTRFDLQSEQRDLRLVVVEGRVSLSAAGKETAVGAGEMTRVLDGATLPVIKLPDLRPEVSWLGKFLVFQATPLREATEEISQRYGVRIDIADPELRDRTVTAWFADRTLDEVLRVVCAASMAECARHPGVVTMKAM